MMQSRGAVLTLFSLGFLAALGCALSNDPSDVKISVRLPAPDPVAAVSRWVGAFSALSAPGTLPASSSDMSCLALNVYGPGLRGVHSNEGPCGAVIASGLVPPTAGSLSIAVPAGPSRTVQVIGVVTQGACPYGEGIQQLLDSQASAVNSPVGGTPPPVELFLIGQATTDLFRPTSLAIEDTYTQAAAEKGTTSPFYCPPPTTTTTASPSPSPSPSPIFGVPSLYYSIAVNGAGFAAAACNAGDLAVSGGVDCSGHGQKRSCSSTDGTNCAPALGGYWVGDCGGVAATAYAVCARSEVAGGYVLSTGFNIQNVATCPAGQIAVAPSVDCSSNGGPITTSCSSDSGGACQATGALSQYWKVKCNGVQPTAGNQGAICYDPSTTGGPTYLLYTNPPSASFCPAEQFATFGQADCAGNAVSASCPDNGGGSCIGSPMPYADAPSWVSGCLVGLPQVTDQVCAY